MTLLAAVILCVAVVSYLLPPRPCQGREFRPPKSLRSSLPLQRPVRNGRLRRARAHEDGDDVNFTYLEASLVKVVNAVFCDTVLSFHVFDKFKSGFRIFAQVPLIVVFSTEGRFGVWLVLDEV